MPRGGARPGAGRKPKTKAEMDLSGGRQRSVVRFPVQPGTQAPAPEADVAQIERPKGLPRAAAATWKRLAPFAVTAGTLTNGTAAAFAMLCRAVVLEKALSASRDAGSASHRGMMQRVEAGFVRFGLSPVGKPMGKPDAKPVDPFAQFDTAVEG